MKFNKKTLLLLFPFGLLGVWLFSKGRGSVSPVSDSSEYEEPLDSLITQNFDPTKDASGKMKHNGIDLRAAVGTPVYSPADGVVSSSGVLSAAGGNQIILTHTNGYKTGYAHLDTILVNTGDNVVKGQQIGTTGNTGTKTTAPHLHFVLIDPTGTPVNPVGVVYPAT
jgi:murein DD-endopeptidase MepM/ murein hydrolase activator NlpD